MAIAYTAPPGVMPDFDKERHHLWQLQEDSYVEWFEAQTWEVEIELGIFQMASTFCTCMW